MAKSKKDFTLLLIALFCSSLAHAQKQVPTERKDSIDNGSNITEPTLKSKACLKCLYFTIIIFDLCRYLEYFSYLYTINQTE